MNGLVTATKQAQQRVQHAFWYAGHSHKLLQCLSGGNKKSVAKVRASGNDDNSRVEAKLSNPETHNVVNAPAADTLTAVLQKFPRPKAEAANPCRNFRAQKFRDDFL